MLNTTKWTPQVPAHILCIWAHKKKFLEAELFAQIRFWLKCREWSWCENEAQFLASRVGRGEIWRAEVYHTQGYGLRTV